MSTNPELFLRDLGNGLILRRASENDADALADMNSRMHSDEGFDHPNLRLAAWTRDLLAPSHPTTRPSDFTIVEETSTGRIVSTLCLIPQTWSYEGIEFGVGRPELVSTLPEFRNRGLVRVQMDMVHRWSEERGHLLQIITGIPYFYRQFGYDMALNFVGRRSGFEPNVPVLKEGETEPFVMRLANESDIEYIAWVYAEQEQRYAISCKRTIENIRYEISGQSDDNINHFQKVVIEDLNGKRLGYFEHGMDLWSGSITCVYFGLTKGISWLKVSPSVVRYLWKIGGEFSVRDSTPRTSFGFYLGENHPVYEALDDNLPGMRKPYAYYVRVPDLPAFLSHIKPALENRLADSIAAGHTGELKLSFYRSGLRISFQDGCITSIEPMKVGPDIEVDASFPDLTFLHLVFGHRSLDELSHAFTDCICENNTARVLVNALFPKRLSDVFAIY